MKTQCTPDHCSIATKMAFVNQVTDENTSLLNCSGTNLLHFKTCQVLVTHPVFKRGVKMVSSLWHTIWEIIPLTTEEQTVFYILQIISIFNTLMINLSMISNSRNIYHLTNMSSKLKQFQKRCQSNDHMPCIIQRCTNFQKSRGHLKITGAGRVT
jgi:hypothetical protein